MRWTVASIFIVVIAGGLGLAAGRSLQQPSGEPTSIVEFSLGSLGTEYGDDTQNYVIVEFGSFDCSVCEMYTEEMFPDVIESAFTAGYSYVYLDMSASDDAQLAAASEACQQSASPASRRSAFAAKRIGSEAVARTIPEDCNVAAVRRQLQQEHAAGVEFGITETPSFLVGRAEGDSLVVGWLVSGLPPRELLRDYLAAAKSD